MTTDTITAPVTPPGHGGVSVIRISGSLVADIGKALLKQLPKPRYAQLSKFYDIDDKLIDQGLALYFPAPHSFTGESILELQGHGSPVVINRLLQRILALGARMAQPGEFSQRAFLNGKLDLAQAEAIADLIEAASEQAASSAMRSLQGEFSRRIQALVDSLIQLRTYVEAAIDFPDEEIDFLSDGRIADQLEQLQQKLSLILSKAKQGALLREGMTLVLVGKPNAGKSSLLNQLSGRDTAIVTAIAGTTRDVLREYIHIDGIPLHILDTAGLRDSKDDIEQKGIKRAKQAMQQANLILLVIDAQLTEPNWQQQYTDIFALNKPIIIVQNKIDLSTHSAHRDTYADQYPQIWLSAKTGDGIDDLKVQLKQAMGFDETIETDFIARTRHLQALQRAQHHLQQGKQQLLYYQAGELLAEELRQAQQAFSEITGEFTNEDLLASIFSSFCIGK